MKLFSFTIVILLFSINTQAQTNRLSENEKADILYLREEEKLARDVYDTMYKKWGLLIFNNIRQSEQMHMNAVKTLIDRFNLTDPVEITMDKAGEFQNVVIKKYYDDLVSVGTSSEMEALKAGAKIEEIDIGDLIEKFQRTKDSFVLETCNHLRSASERHLNAFVRNIKMRGEIYEPFILDKTLYRQLINRD